MRQPRGLYSAFGLALVQQVPLGELLPVLVLMLEDRRQLPALLLEPLRLLVLLLAFSQRRHLRQRVHHPGHHREVLLLHPLDLPLGAVVTVEVLLPVLEVIDLRVVLLAAVRVEELHEELVVGVADVVGDALLDLLLAERETFEVAFLLLFLAFALLLWGGGFGDLADLVHVHLVPLLLHEYVTDLAAALGVEHDLSSM
jgi:hypothetical protein